MPLLIALLLITFPLISVAIPIQINDVQVLPQENNQGARLIFSTTAPVLHNIFTLSNPERVVIDFKNTQLNKNLTLPTHQSLLKNMRSALRNDTDLRIVLDLQEPANAKSFILKSKNRQDHRLVVEVDKISRAPPPIVAVAPPTTPLITAKLSSEGRDLIVAIDAGHGGIDPGASGQGGTKEKHIALSIARELSNLIAKEPGMRAVLIRNGDYFLTLRNRMELARENNADVFVSIHADAYPDTTMQGTSVYMLSQRGVSSEAAKWLADKENSVDLVGGVSLNDKDNLLASVLLDLSQTVTLEASAHIGDNVLKYLKKIGKVHHPKVQRAGFMVLRSPDIPSILVETGFITSPTEETRLSTPEYRQQIANAILEGIRDYFVKNPPFERVVAQQH